MKLKMPKVVGSLLMSLAIIAIVPTFASAHCDTMDGPVIGDAQKAIAENNLNYALKWVFPESEQELKDVFELTMKVRGQSPEVQELADKYFFENFVRIHRAGEGAPYTGVKPHGTPIEEAVAAADKSIEIGDLSPLENLVPEEKKAELQERFEKVLATKDFDINDVEAGREYIEAYVQFFHFAEGEEGHAEGEAHGEEGHATEEGHDAAAQTEDGHDEATDEAAKADDSQKAAESLPVIPWSLAGILFITTLIFGIGYFRKTSK